MPLDYRKSAPEWVQNTAPTDSIVGALSSYNVTNLSPDKLRPLVASGDIWAQLNPEDGTLENWGANTTAGALLLTEGEDWRRDVDPNISPIARAWAIKDYLNIPYADIREGRVDLSQLGLTPDQYSQFASAAEQLEEGRNQSNTAIRKEGQRFNASGIAAVVGGGLLSNYLTTGSVAGQGFQGMAPTTGGTGSLANTVGGSSVADLTADPEIMKLFSGGTGTAFEQGAAISSAQNAAMTAGYTAEQLAGLTLEQLTNLPAVQNMINNGVTPNGTQTFPNTTNPNLTDPTTGLPKVTNPGGGTPKIPGLPTTTGSDGGGGTSPSIWDNIGNIIGGAVSGATNLYGATEMQNLLEDIKKGSDPFADQRSRYFEPTAQSSARLGEAQDLAMRGLNDPKFWDQSWLNDAAERAGSDTQKKLASQGYNFSTNTINNMSKNMRDTRAQFIIPGQQNLISNVGAQGDATKTLGSLAGSQFNIGNAAGTLIGAQNAINNGVNNAAGNVFAGANTQPRTTQPAPNTSSFLDLLNSWGKTKPDPVGDLWAGGSGSPSWAGGGGSPSWANPAPSPSAWGDGTDPFAGGGGGW